MSAATSEIIRHRSAVSNQQKLQDELHTVIKKSVKQRFYLSLLGMNQSKYHDLNNLCDF